MRQLLSIALAGLALEFAVWQYLVLAQRVARQPFPALEHP